MIVGIAALLLFQLLGETAAYLTSGVVPGPVIGMAMIAVFLSATRGRATSLQSSTVATSKLILANLGLLFIPAGVGIVKHLDLVAEHGVALLAVIVLSTTVTLCVTVWSFILVKRLQGGRRDG
ncbi:CidA/LrgA family protein [Rhizobium sp. BK060]|uniref:CidA/LrgA family protein n=1 Tax=Rhizobium sp. BK060 TaxID=2587096 RepID=UPI001618AD67|nr:CidA/LrgA family protein [Rhizobium sp. BK060]MBB3396060.1 holin-like protein [Rhizobium sp. BK060]